MLFGQYLIIVLSAAERPEYIGVEKLNSIVKDQGNCFNNLSSYLFDHCFSPTTAHSGGKQPELEYDPTIIYGRGQPSAIFLVATSKISCCRITIYFQSTFLVSRQAPSTATFIQMGCQTPEVADQDGKSRLAVQLTPTT